MALLTQAVVDSHDLERGTTEASDNVVMLEVVAIEQTVAVMETQSARYLAIERAAHPTDDTFTLVLDGPGQDSGNSPSFSKCQFDESSLDTLGFDGEEEDDDRDTLIWEQIPLPQEIA